ncbi:MAG: DUF2318 domain-containing protein [Candidatus Heimdallarchaeota archaeon]|nr:MAG: DUF2318 domain-containing protein [Candidatus Heimdallarchaeota archaeon]
MKARRMKAKKLVKKEGDHNWNMVLAIVVVTVVGFSAILFLQGNNDPNSSNPISRPQKDGDNLVLSVSSLNTKVKFFGYKSGVVQISYFAVLGSDEQVRLAFDACDVCFAEKKGYRQNGDVMVCNNCGKQFHIDGIGTENVQGGCWPSYLPITVAEGNVRIRISDVVSKKYMFE